MEDLCRLWAWLAALCLWAWAGAVGVSSWTCFALRLPSVRSWAAVPRALRLGSVVSGILGCGV